MMLSDHEVMDIKIGDLVEAEVKGSIITITYNFYHERITDGVIIIELPLNRILWSDIRISNLSICIDDRTETLSVSNEDKATIRGDILNECKFSLRYRIKEVVKEMTLKEIEKALGHKVKIVSR